jgi:hypothetical protein
MEKNGQKVRFFPLFSAIFGHMRTKREHKYLKNTKK